LVKADPLASITACEVKFWVPNQAIPVSFLPWPKRPKSCRFPNLAGDEFQAAVLPVLFLLDQRVHFGVLILERGIQAGVLISAAKKNRTLVRPPDRNVKLPVLLLTQESTGFVTCDTEPLTAAMASREVCFVSTRPPCFFLFGALLLDGETGSKMQPEQKQRTGYIIGIRDHVLHGIGAR
jgi:hypothetical protein